MSKSVYSLVLNDQLVDALDAVAYKKGMSRSNMINTIIADYLSIETPEKRIADVFNHLQALVEPSQTLKFVAQQSAGLASICSAVSFRYNPTVRYTVELFLTHDDGIGELKVSLRSTNAQLLDAVSAFFVLFAKLEKKHIGETFARVENGRFFRRLRLDEGVVLNNDQLGEAILEYVKNVDELLNFYFQNLDDVAFALPILEDRYVDNLKRQKVIFR